MSCWLLFAQLLFGVSQLSGSGHEPARSANSWYSDYDLAQQRAQQEGKPMLMVFVGSGWCPWSDELARTVLTQKEFTDRLSRDFILLKFNCPENDEDSSLKELKQRYRVEQCPVFLLVESSGEKIAQVDYLALDVKGYESHLKGLLGDFRHLKKTMASNALAQLPFAQLKQCYEKARRLAHEGFKQAILQVAVQVDPGIEFLMEEYRGLFKAGQGASETAHALRDKIMARDPDNQLGSRLKLAMLEFERLMKEENRQDKPLPLAQVMHPLLDYLKQFGQEAQQSWEVEMALSHYLFRRNQMEEALKHAQASYKAAPKEEKEQVAKTVDYLEKQLLKISLDADP